MLKFILDSLEGVDEVTAPLYKQVDGGKFQLQVDGLPAADKPSTELTTALQTERRNVASLKNDIKSWKALGVDPETVMTQITHLKDEIKEASKGNKPKEDYDRMLEQHQANWDTEKTTLTAENDSLKASERSAIIDNRLTTSFMEAGFTKEGLALMPDRYSKRIQIEANADGKRVITILTPELDAPMVGSGDGNRATFADLAKEASTKFPSLVSSDRLGGGGGGGKGGGSGNEKTMVRGEWAKLGEVDKGKILSEGTVLID